MRPTPAAVLLTAMLATAAGAQTTTTYDEPGPGRSNVSPTARSRAPRTTVGTPAQTTSPAAPKTTQSTGAVRSAPAARTSAMSVNTRPSGRWITLRKIYPEGFARMPLTYGRIMPIGLPRIPEKVVGHVRPTMALLESPRRFLTETPMPTDAPMSVLRNKRAFEPDLIRAHIRDGEHAKLAPAASAAHAERGRASSDRAQDERFERCRREHQFRVAGIGPPTPNERIGSGISDPNLRPRYEEGFDPRTLATDTPRALTELQSHLKTHPDDFHSQRLLAIAHLASRDAAQAATTMAQAYASDPLLASEPLDLAALGFEPARIPPLTALAAGHANKDATNAHLLTLVLHQAQGHKDKAKATLDRARKAGLSHELADLFAEALR
ncbi:MAG TPA: hypothetical protein VD997_10570 [Phycisphaerales bacterium]|nr:hypothetical protein [Phycisphaerales bacterium]